MAEIELEYVEVPGGDAVAPAGPSKSTWVRSRGHHYLLPLVLPLVLLVIWELLSRKGLIRPTILPAPSTIWETGRELLVSGELLRHLAVSLWRVTKGFALGAGFGLVGGLVIGLNPKAERAVSLITGLLRPIPIIAWVPVLILWMGIDEASKMTVIAIGSFWPVLLNVIHGIRNTDRRILEVATVFQKSRSTLLVKVILPAALPSIFTGLRIGIGIAWMSVVGAELIAASSGVGYLIMYARELSQADVMLVGVVSIGVTGLVIDYLIRKLERRLLRWNVNLH
jgi:sulfonate transport system permease protein